MKSHASLVLDHNIRHGYENGPHASPTVVPAQADLCTTVIPAKAGIQGRWAGLGCVDWDTIVPAQSLPPSSRGREPNPRSLPPSIWYLGISRPRSYSYVTFDKLRVSGGPRLWGDQPDSVKRMINGTMIAVVARVAITPAKRR